MEWSRVGWGAAVTRRAGLWPGGGTDSVSELQQLAHAVQTHRPRAAGACGFLRKLKTPMLISSLDFQMLATN